MVIGLRRRAIGVFSHRRDVEDALHELRDAGFPMDRVSVLVRHADRSDRIAGAKVTKRIGNKAEEGSTIGVLSGGALGGLTGLLVGLGSLAIPGVGPIMLAGATATALATTIAGAGIGAVTGGLLGALIGLGIPEERAKAYTQRIQQGHYLVIINGTDAEIAQAEAILRHHGIEDFAVYDISDGRHRVTAPVSRDVGVSKHAIGYFSNLRDAEGAINDLRSAGFPLSQISLIHRDVSRRDRFPSVTVGDRLDDTRLRLPDARSRFYNERINQGDYVVVVNGTDADIQRAAPILNKHKIQQWEIFEPTVIHAPVSTDVGVSKHGIGYFSNLRDAEGAINDLRSAGFPLSQISLIHKDVSRRDRFPSVTVRDRLDDTRLRLPDARSRFYNERINQGDYVVVVNGTDADIQRAAPILNKHKIQQWEIFEPTVIHAPVSRDVGVSKHAIGYFSNLRDAEGAINDLRSAGFALSQISLIHKDVSRPDRFPSVTVRDRLDDSRLRLPDARSRFYNERINQGDYVVVINATDAELHHATPILNKHKIQQWEIVEPIATARRAVGVFSHPRDVEAGLLELRDSGFPMNQVSVIGKVVNSSDRIAANTKADEGVKAGVATGATLGSLGGLLVGSGVLEIPGIGPVMAGGNVATSLATAMTGSAIGAGIGGLTGGLVGLGIPENRARVYSDRFNKGDYLVFVDGTDEQIRHAEAILKRRGIQELDVFDAADLNLAHHEAPITDTTHTDYSPTLQHEEPKVIIIDRRKEKL